MGVVRDGLRTDHVTWGSPLGIDAAEQALSALGLRSPGQPLLTTGPLRGRYRAPTVTATKRSIFNNTWRPVLRGQLTAAPNGCRLDAEIGLARPALVFSAAWAVGAIALGVLGVVLAIAQSQPNALIALVMPVLGIGIIAIGTQMSFGDRAFLRTTIGGALNGTEISTQGATT